MPAKRKIGRPMCVKYSSDRRSSSYRVHRQQRQSMPTAAHDIGGCSGQAWTTGCRRSPPVKRFDREHRRGRSSSRLRGLDYKEATGREKVEGKMQKSCEGVSISPSITFTAAVDHIYSFWLGCVPSAPCSPRNLRVDD